MNYRKPASFKSAADFQAYLEKNGVALPFDSLLSEPGKSPLAQPLAVDGLNIGNRFAVLPMEGWDAQPDGNPSELTLRRWRNFGASGAKLVWGGEAAAVRPDGRANPNQLVIAPETLAGLIYLRDSLVKSHREATGSSEGLVIGLQLTHSGRFCRPNGKTLEPRLAYDHPLLNPRFGLPIPSDKVFSDGELEELVQDYIRAAALAQEAGFDFVDVKHCHGYLLHEFLSAVERPGRYGGSLENRTRLAWEIITGIQSAAPGLGIGVRLSLYDFVPFRPGDDRVGQAVATGADVPFLFGGDGSGVGYNLDEPAQFISMLSELGVKLICATAGSPYYNPHIQRPAYFPPSDAYLPPEDPLLGVARQIAATAELKARFPGMIIVGSGYSCLQEWLPHVAQAVIRGGQADFVGLGRMVLSYPEMPADILAGRALQSKRICRTFSDCTTAPRNGMVSGCYPIDPFYRERPEVEKLMEIKRGAIG